MLITDPNNGPNAGLNAGSDSDPDRSSRDGYPPSSFQECLATIAGWRVPMAAAAVITASGISACEGPVSEVTRIASIAKLLTTYATLIACEEGTVGLDDAVGPPGSTLRHLLSHASGYGFESNASVLAPPGSRRIYSNRGIEEAAAHVARASAMPFADYLAEAVLEPLGMTATELRTSPAFGVWSNVEDLALFVGELLAPRLIDRSTLSAATTVQFAGLAGVLPGVGRFDPLDWGLGFEIRARKAPHWSGRRTAPVAFGHFGGAGTFLWVDPSRTLALVCCTDREFGDWAMDAWPPLSDAVVDVADRAEDGPDTDERRAMGRFSS